MMAQRTVTPVLRQRPILLCLSHLRWDFVFQRPQHLLFQAIAAFEVVFFEEPKPTAQPDDAPHLAMRRTSEGVLVATPLLPSGLDVLSAEASQRGLLPRCCRILERPSQWPGTTPRWRLPLPATSQPVSWCMTAWTS